MQTVFLRLLNRNAAGTVINKEESYLRRAAVNASVDLLRSRHPEQQLPLNESSAPRQSGSSIELRECLRRALASLNPRSAEIFALRYFEDLTNQQIAETLRISQVLVAVTLHRTRRQLQDEIRSYFGGKS